MLFTFDLHEDFINVEGVAVASVFSLQSPGIYSPEFDAPEPDDVGWESVAFVCIHPEIIHFRELSCQYR